MTDSGFTSLRSVPTAQDDENIDSLLRRVLLLGEYYSFVDQTPMSYLRRVIEAVRREADPLREILRQARWYVADHQESQPNDESRDLLAVIDGVLK